MFNLLRTIVLILNLFFISKSLLSQGTKDSLVALCLAHCSNGTNNIINNCYQSSSTVVRTSSIREYDTNPYEEFDLVVSYLKKDIDNPFPLIYFFRSCDHVCNAASVMIDNHRYIYYNQSFINGLSSNSVELKWIVRCIIAHEIGHHVLEHTLPGSGNLYPEQRRKQELLADYFGSFVIKQFPGSTLNNALAGINALDATQYIPQNETQEMGAEYPTLANRRKAIIEGFTHDIKNPLRIAMFKKLDSIGARNLQRLGSTIILRQIDKLISFNNIKEAEENLALLEKQQMLSPEQKSTIMNLKSMLNKFKNGTRQPVIDQIKLNKEDIENLKEIYYKIINSNVPVEKIKAESLRKTIQELEKIKN